MPWCFELLISSYSLRVHGLQALESRIVLFLVPGSYYIEYSLSWLSVLLEKYPSVGKQSFLFSCDMDTTKNSVNQALAALPAFARWGLNPFPVTCTTTAPG